MQEKGNLSINSENFLPIIKKWLYTDKDIFIRELVSNACDAVTKLQKLNMMGEADIPTDEKYEIHVVLDQDNKTLQIMDNGIGMTADEIKKYINEPTTTPFAIMYLATEGLYSEIISSRNAVAERCQSEFSVMIAGPSTITALLNSLSVGFRAMAINEKAKEVRVVLAAAKVQYDKFGVLLDKARKKITEAGKSLDDAQSRNNIIQKKLKSVEEIDRTSAEEILGIGDMAEDFDE